LNFLALFLSHVFPNYQYSFPKSWPLHSLFFTLCITHDIYLYVHRSTPGPDGTNPSNQGNSSYSKFNSVYSPHNLFCTNRASIHHCKLVSKAVQWVSYIIVYKVRKMIGQSYIYFYAEQHKYCDIIRGSSKVFTKLTFGISRKSKFYTKVVLISQNFRVFLRIFVLLSKQNFV
jgi:hypothetical protein